MEVIEAIKTRRSIRGFKPDPVPKDIIAQVLEVALRVPSGTNCQPWEITVVTGDCLDELRHSNTEHLKAGDPGQPDIPRGSLGGIYKLRANQVAVQLFGLLGIARHDLPQREAWLRRGCCYFDAPVAIFVYVDPEVGDARGLFDCGALTQNICLAGLAFGLGACIQGQGVTYSGSVKRIAGIPPHKRLITSIAIGYPDWDYPANQLVTDREPLENISRWVGFDK